MFVVLCVHDCYALCFVFSIIIIPVCVAGNRCLWLASTRNDCDDVLLVLLACLHVAESNHTTVGIAVPLSQMDAVALYAIV